MAILVAGLVVAGLVVGWRLVVAAGGDSEPGQPPIQVLVLDERGAPLEGAWVCVCDVAAEIGAPLGVESRIRPPSGYESYSRTDAFGRASLALPSAGSWRVWAGKRSLMYVPSPELVLDQDSPAQELTLTTRPAPDDQLIGGALVDPDGEPVAGAMVSFYWVEQGELERRGASTDEHGRFLFAVDRAGLSGALLVRMYDERLGSNLVEPVSAGQRDLRVRMRPRRTFEIVVRGADGEPIDRPRASMERLVVGKWRGESPGPKTRPGEALVRTLPSVPFRLRVGGGDHRSVVLGPFEPDQMDAVLEVELERSAKASGRVTFEGQPVRGARVSRSSARPLEATGELTPWSGVRGTARTGGAYTDKEGRFEFSVYESFAGDLIARKAPHGDGRLRGVLLNAESGVDGLEIELTQGGAIHGRLRPPAGEEPSEVYVHFGGAAETFYTAVDDDGRFFVEGLTAGTWALTLGERWPGFPEEREEVGHRLSMFDASPDTPPAWWSPRTPLFVEVSAGGRVELEWDVARPLACSIEGRVLLDGRPPKAVLSGFLGRKRVSACRATLERDGEHASRSSATAGDDGRFVLAVDEPGWYLLRMRVFFADYTDLQVLERVELRPGTSRWTFEVPTGRLALRVGEQSRSKRHLLTFVARGPGERIVVAREGVEDRERGLRLLLHLPAGSGEVFIEQWGAPVDVLAEVEIVPGGEVFVEVP